MIISEHPSILLRVPALIKLSDQEIRNKETLYSGGNMFLEQDVRFCTILPFLIFFLLKILRNFRRMLSLHSDMPFLVLIYPKTPIVNSMSLIQF